MQIRYKGDQPVDVAGHLEVATDDVIEVDDAVGASLLLAGWSFADPDESGVVVSTPPERLIWERADTDKPKSKPKADPVPEIQE